jgi:hypothetical protein
MQRLASRRGASRSSFYATLDSWSRARRVIGEAEHLANGANGLRKGRNPGGGT